MTSNAPMPVPVTLTGRIALEPRWVLWKREKHRKSGKLTRVPYIASQSVPGQPKRGYEARYKARSNEPGHWRPRAIAEKALVSVRLSYGGLSGLGMIIGARTPATSTPIAGFDLDDCFNLMGDLEPWAQEVVDAFPGYWERSPSDTGLHGLFRYRWTDHERIKEALKAGTQWVRPVGYDHGPAIDLFFDRGYFTITENMLPGSTDTIEEIPTDVILHLIEVTGPAFGEKKGTGGKPGRGGGTGGKPKRGSKGVTTGWDRSAWAMSLAVKTVTHNLGKQSFIQALYADPDGKAWAQEAFPHNEDNAWNNAVEKYGWAAEWHRNDKGKPLNNLDNVLTALRHGEAYDGLFSYEEMLRAPILTKPVPNSKEAWAGARPVRDVDVAAVQELLQENYLVGVSKDTAHQAVELVAWERKFHPVVDYLKRLEWDRVDRLDGWLATYMGATPSPYVSAIGRMFLISMVARILKPGCKVDYTLILEGEQSTQKSTACQILAGEWFSDQLPDIHDKDRTAQHLRGKWLIEIPELSAIRKADVETLKAFLTRQVERYRPPYGRLEVIEPRQCVLIGTTNQKTYLHDEIGNRRVWPIDTGFIDVGALKRDRDQLFAEAVVRYQHEESWWPDREFEKIHIKPEQDARFVVDDWQEIIDLHIHDEDRTTTIEIARDILHIDQEKITTAITHRVSSCLRALGWIYRRTTTERYWKSPREL